MKKIMFLAIMMFLLPSFCFAHWADVHVEMLKNNGVLQEVFSIDSIELDRAITREEFFTLVAVSDNTIKSEPIEDFADYNQVNSKFALYVGGFVNSGIVAGVPENGKLYIKPNVAITRQEAAIILSKVFELTDENYEVKFNDANSISKWAKPYFAGVIKNGIINGYPDNTVKPINNITVAEAISIVANSYNKGYFVSESVSTFAGAGEAVLNDGTNLEATFAAPSDIVIKNGKFYVVDSANNAIRCIDNNFVSTVNGSDIGRNEYGEGIGSFKDGKNALFDNPTCIVTLDNGFLVSDTGNNLIRFINNNGYTTTFAGNLKSGFANGKVNAAKFNSPRGIAVDSEGNVYIADTGNNVIRKIDVNKNVTTFAGNNKKVGYKDGTLKNAQFNAPMGIKIVNDVIYVADTGNQRIRMIKDGVVSTYAGNGVDKDDYGVEIIGGYLDGDKNIAKFNYPVNITLDSKGNIYVADKGNGAIRKIDLDGNVTTITNDVIKRPSGIVIKDDVLYVTDMLLNKIFRIKI